MRQTKVLVVGAGPVGLLLAAELCRDGIDVLLIEKHAERTCFSKALGITARTLEIFEDLGIADAAIDNGVWFSGITVFENNVQVRAIDVPDRILSYGALALPQFETERILEALLQRHAGKVHYGATLLGFSETAEGVTATVAGLGSEVIEIACKFLIGCDGALSTVRSGLGLNFESDKSSQTFALADVEIEWQLPRGRMYRFNTVAAGGATSGSLVAIPVHGKLSRYRLSAVLDHGDAGTAEVQSPDLERVRTLMQPLLPPGSELSALRWSSIYRASHRIVPHYGTARVFLAGDAAHIHPPVDDQGMNTGLQDAHNLAWKLTLAGRGKHSSELLGSYSAERHPVGLDVVEATSRTMNEVMAQKINVPGLRHTQLLTGYRGSLIVKDDRAGPNAALPAPGDPAPDAGQLKQAFVLHPTRLRERIGKGRHLLVGFVGVDGIEAFGDMVDLLQARLGDAASGIAIAARDRPPGRQERLPVLTDAAREFADTYGAKPGMVWLIRPDGHIGFAGDTLSQPALDGYLSRICSLRA